MLRRTKAEVLPQLAEKNRYVALKSICSLLQSVHVHSETVVLDPALVWTNDDAKTSLNEMSSQLEKAKGRSREEVLLRFYAQTAQVKTRAVW